MITRSALLAALIAVAVLLTAAPVQAADDPERPSRRTFASGLDNPRGLAFGPDGRLYVAEAGRGGRGPCRPGPDGRLRCFGRTGAIAEIGAGGQRRIRRNLPSMAFPQGGGAVGPSDVAVGPDGTLTHVMGEARVLIPYRRGLLILDERGLRRVGPRGRTWTVARIADATAVALGPDGAYYVAGRDRIWRAEPGRTPQVYASGLPGVVDLAWSGEGVLHVVQSSGALRRLTRTGSLQVTTGLTAPGGLAIRGRYAYVTVCGVCQGTGAVVRIPLRAQPET
ncbi:ScyD/ScyE family protein [Actinoplanes sp. NPDC051861]|uniref:ScyD/ScyE family protein n=1 Tax=Actinoplanes sp. NPDC051861 TaxID=3155170 RepID=UPI00342F1B60